MKNQKNISAMFAIVIATVLAAATAPAATNYFSNVGGPLWWDDATNNWSTVTGGPYTGAWTANDDAVFEGTAGTVNVNAVSANSLTFSISDYTLTGGTITMTGAAAINVDTLATINSILAGNSGLTKNGTGTLILTAANTYTGGTTVTGGTLSLGAQPSAGTGVIRNSLTINSGATVLANSTGQWSLGYNNGTAVSAITINGGVLQFGAGGGGTSATNITMTGGTISGSQWDWYNGITSTPTLNVNATPGGSVISSGINLRLAGGTLTVNVTDNGTPADGLLISGAIVQNATANFTKTGAGQLTLTGTNTFTGGTTINGGTLAIAGAGRLGNGSYAGSIANNATFVYSSSAPQTLSGAITGTGALIQNGPGTLTLANDGDTYSGATLINQGQLVLSNTGGFRSPVTILNGATLEFATSSNTTFGNGSSISGTGTVVKTGIATLILGGSDYSTTVALGAGSLIDIQAGAIRLDWGYNKSTWSNNLASVNIANGGTFNMWDYGSTVSQSLNFDGLTGTGTVDKGITGTVTLKVGVNNASSTFGGVIKNTLGTINLIKAGSGALTLSSNNTYSGTTTITGGSLWLGIDNALPVTTGLYNGNGGTFYLNGHTQTVTRLSYTGGSAQ